MKNFLSLTTGDRDRYCEENKNVKKCNKYSKPLIYIASLSIINIIYNDELPGHSEQTPDVMYFGFIIWQKSGQ